MEHLEFWLVWSPEGERPPRHEHHSAKAAADEAERLATVYPGKSFYVLHATEMRRTADAPVEACTLLKRPEPELDDDIPF
ncbi:hypothetical protein [Variovorax paradoxus]|uniref:hypothetical protein n=1 Tax=Variovorax paradoxus TaxID=34073 RepID=UPI001931C0BD|nr:hypothetical protein INQ48_13715 [Variovorax paradoxus]